MNKDLELFTRFINKKYTIEEIEKYGQFLSIYPFTTEKIDGYMNNLDLTNKRILTTGSSSDHVFNSILNGATNITLVDINPFIKYYYGLKKAGIKMLSYNDFFRYFASNELDGNKFNINIFNKRYYDILKGALDEEDRYFWDYMFKHENPRYIRTDGFSYEEPSVEELKKANNYLKSRNEYLHLRAIINDAKVDFINDNIESINLKKRYDYMFLSNISMYLCENWNDNPYKSLYNFLTKLSNNLTEDGLLYFAYLYQTNLRGKYDKRMPAIYNHELILQLIKEVYKEDFESFKNGKVDSILVYKKEK